MLLQLLPRNAMESFMQGAKRLNLASCWLAEVEMSLKQCGLVDLRRPGLPGALSPTNLYQAREGQRDNMAHQVCDKDQVDLLDL